ncbi:MAG: 50S ribosomal protein L22 [Gammaproteobacteria bacterium]|nr:50S ribosomal protein L22 [Gammaproteobacteria bacterium]
MATAKAIYKKVRISPTKVRPLANLIRGRKTSEALNILTFHRSGAAAPLKKTLLSAVANVEHNLGENADDFSVSKIMVDAAPVMKRMRFRARGRANRIIKRSCHVSIELSN